MTSAADTFVSAAGIAISSVCAASALGGGVGDGLLFGAVHRVHERLVDDSVAGTSEKKNLISITNAVPTGRSCSFYRANGDIDVDRLLALLKAHGGGRTLVGWYRTRHGHMRPSMRDVQVHAALQQAHTLHKDAFGSVSPPLIFGVFSSAREAAATINMDYAFYVLAPRHKIMWAQNVSVANLQQGPRAMYREFVPLDHGSMGAGSMLRRYGEAGGAAPPGDVVPTHIEPPEHVRQLEATAQAMLSGMATMAAEVAAQELEIAHLEAAVAQTHHGDASQNASTQSNQHAALPLIDVEVAGGGARGGASLAIEDDMLPEQEQEPEKERGQEEEQEEEAEQEQEDVQPQPTGMADEALQTAAPVVAAEVAASAGSVEAPGSGTMALLIDLEPEGKDDNNGQPEQEQQQQEQQQQEQQQGQQQGQQQQQPGVGAESEPPSEQPHMPPMGPESQIF